MAALATVEEVEVDVHRSTVAAESHRQRPFHLIGVERATAFVAGRTLDRFAGVGRHPDLGVDARDGHRCRPHLLRRHDPELRDPMRVGLVPRSLVDRLGFGDDAVGAHLAHLRDLGPPAHEGVELQELIAVDDHAECRGAGVFRAEDAPNLVVAHDALRSATAARKARYTSPGSPIRWRRSGASAPIGTRFCGARGSMCGWDATRGSSAAARSAIVRTVASGRCADASHRTSPLHAWPSSTRARRTYHEYRP